MNHKNLHIMHIIHRKIRKFDNLVCKTISEESLKKPTEHIADFNTDSKSSIKYFPPLFKTLVNVELQLEPTSILLLNARPTPTPTPAPDIFRLRPKITYSVENSRLRGT